MRRLLITLGAFAMVAAACASDTSPTAAEPPSTQASAGAPSLETKGPITSADDMPPATQPSASATTAPVGEEPSPDATTAVPVQASDLPPVEVIDLNGDTTFNVASLVPSDRPIVVWFWAPH